MYKIQFIILLFGINYSVFLFYMNTVILSRKNNIFPHICAFHILISELAFLLLRSVGRMTLDSRIAFLEKVEQVISMASTSNS